MAIVFADPFGSYIEGAQEGQKFEQDYQESAIDSYSKEMSLLDKLVLSPQRALEKEQRQYARSLDLMIRRDALARSRQEDAALLRGGSRSSGGGGMFFSMGSGASAPQAPQAANDGFNIRPRGFYDRENGLPYSMGE